MKNWYFQENLIFARFDSFVERVKTIQEFCNTASQFLKLEKVEIGGLRGKRLTQAVQKIHEQFKEIHGVFGNRLVFLNQKRKICNSGPMTALIQKMKDF